MLLKRPKGHCWAGSFSSGKKALEKRIELSDNLAVANPPRRIFGTVMETTEVVTTTVTTTSTTETVVKVEENVEEIKSNENHVEETKPEDAEEENEAEASPKPEENGDIAQPKVRLDQHPPWPKIPSPLPECLTIETYLRMMKLPYECTYKATPDWSKLPAVVFEGTTKKQDIIEFLVSKFGVDPDASLSEEQKAVSRAFQLMVGESTAWSLVHYRWIDNYTETKKYYKGKGLLVPDVRTKLEKNKCSKCLEAHTIGKHTKEQIYSIAEKDLRALSTYLADKEFFMGSEPTTIDCTMFGLLANFVYPDDTRDAPQRKLIVDELRNLLDFCDRVKRDYWLDWNDVCNDEIVEEMRPKKPSLRRKKRTKSSTDAKVEAESGEKPEEKKEENGGEEAAPVENAASPEESKEDEGAKEGEEGKDEGEKNDDEAPASPGEASEQPAQDAAE